MITQNTHIDGGRIPRRLREMLAFRPKYAGTRAPQKSASFNLATRRNLRDLIRRTRLSFIDT